MDFVLLIKLNNSTTKMLNVQCSKFYAAIGSNPTFCQLFINPEIILSCSLSNYISYVN